MSSCLAPWLDTTIPEAPNFTANSASSGVKIPFKIIGRGVILKFSIIFLSILIIYFIFLLLIKPSYVLPRQRLIE